MEYPSRTVHMAAYPNGTSWVYSQLWGCADADDIISWAIMLDRHNFFHNKFQSYWTHYYESCTLLKPKNLWFYSVLTIENFSNYKMKGKKKKN